MFSIEFQVLVLSFCQKNHNPVVNIISLHHHSKKFSSLNTFIVNPILIRQFMRFFGHLAENALMRQSLMFHEWIRIFQLLRSKNFIEFCLGVKFHCFPKMYFIVFNWLNDLTINWACIIRIRRYWDFKKIRCKIFDGS